MSEEGFAIAWVVPARRTLARLPEKVATAAVQFLYGSLAENPRRVGTHLRLGLSGLHSARRGDYRVIYRIDDDIRQVTVLAIEHRSDIYRPRLSLESLSRRQKRMAGLRAMYERNLRLRS